MKRVADIFAAFNGPASLARAIGVRTEHATLMKRRNSIPIRYWPALIAEAKRRGIALNVERLLQAHLLLPGVNADANKTIGRRHASPNN